MTASQKRTLGILLSFALLGAIFYLRATKNLGTQDYHNSNFFTFWVSGRLIATGGNPYDEVQYQAAYQNYGSTWMPNKIFHYPLPLALFMVPFGLFSLENAYVLWQIISQFIIAITVYIFLGHWKNAIQQRLLIPITLFLLYFGPAYLTIQISSVGALTLLILLGAILALEKDKSLLAGVLLSLTMLKPSQGITILFLAGIWFLAHRNWKAITGVALGGVLILVVGLIQDPQWISKFREVSQALVDRTQGVHSNVWAFTYMACGGTAPCSTLLGAAGSATLLGLGGFFLWKNQAQLSAWEAFNIIIPLGFVSTVYLWAYDQILYIIPIVWVIGMLVERTKKYIHAFVFLFVLVVFSFYALVQQASTGKDLWSLGTTVIVLGMVLGLLYMNRKKPIDIAPAQHRHYLKLNRDTD